MRFLGRVFRQETASTLITEGCQTRAEVPFALACARVATARSVDVSQSSIPAGTSLLDAARQTVDRLRASTPWEPPGGVLDTVEIVHVCPTPDAGWEPGVLMTWHQGENLFGLAIPIGRLAFQSGDLDAVPAYLMLAVDEPHGPTVDGSRLWFFDLPSGPY